MFYSWTAITSNTLDFSGLWSLSHVHFGDQTHSTNLWCTLRQKAVRSDIPPDFPIYETNRRGSNAHRGSVDDSRPISAPNKAQEARKIRPRSPQGGRKGNEPRKSRRKSYIGQPVRTVEDSNISTLPYLGLCRGISTPCNFDQTHPSYLCRHSKPTKKAKNTLTCSEALGETVPAFNMPHCC